MTKSRNWKFDDDDGSKTTTRQLLYNELISTKFSIANKHQLLSMNVILSDKWKMFIASMSFIERNARWSESFTSHDMVKDSDREWRAFETIKVDGDFHYVVMYENVQLAKKNQRRYKDIRRRIGITESEKENNAQSSVKVFTDFETRVKYGIIEDFVVVISKNIIDDSEDDEDSSTVSKSKRDENKNSLEENDDNSSVVAKGKRKQNKNAFEKDDDLSVIAKGKDKRKRYKNIFDDDDDSFATAKGRRKQNKNIDVDSKDEKNDKAVFKLKIKSTARKRQFVKSKDRENNVFDEDNSEVTTKVAKKRRLKLKAVELNEKNVVAEEYETKKFEKAIAKRGRKDKAKKNIDFISVKSIEQYVIQLAKSLNVAKKSFVVNVASVQGSVKKFLKESKRVVSSNADNLVRRVIQINVDISHISENYDFIMTQENAKKIQQLKTVIKKQKHSMTKRNKLVRKLKTVLKNTTRIVFTFSKMLYYFRDQIATEKLIDNRLFDDHDKSVMKFFNTCKIFERKYQVNIVSRVRDNDRFWKTESSIASFIEFCQKYDLRFENLKINLRSDENDV